MVVGVEEKTRRGIALAGREDRAEERRAGAAWREARGRAVRSIWSVACMTLGEVRWGVGRGLGRGSSKLGCLELTATVVQVMGSRATRSRAARFVCREIRKKISFVASEGEPRRPDSAPNRRVGGSKIETGPFSCQHRCRQPGPWSVTWRTGGEVPLPQLANWAETHMSTTVRPGHVNWATGKSVG